MATKVDTASSVGPGHIQSTVSMSTSSVASASSPKVSMFGKKSGFVIPKNKLSGSLVPIYRGGAKVEGGSSVKEEGTKQVQRKTKWGVDLTQDAAVRKGRALAYQTRLEQITQQLSSGALEIADDQDSQSSKQDVLDDENHERSLKRIDSLKMEALDLERREVIGEILRLNPSYKTPLDYKPLLKEAKVPVPVSNKAYPGYNFIGLLLGSESNTQKRLEEETGAKVRVQGTKVDAGEKREITLSDITDAQGTQDLVVHVSADTYEKVDAAVALIELLLTPVSGGSAVASTNSSAAGDSTTTSVYVTPPMAIASQGVLQPAFMPVQPAPAQFHSYHAPWFQTAPSSGPHPPSGFMPMHMPNNLMRFPPPPVGPVSQPYFGQPPFGSLPRTQSPPANRPQLPMQAMQQPPNQAIGHQNRPLQGPQPPPAYSVMRPHPNSTAPPFTSAKPTPAGSLQMSGPPLTPNSGSAPSGPLSNMPLRAPGPPGNSLGWPSPPVVSAPLRPNNVTQMAPPSINTPGRPPQLGFPNNMTARPLVVNFAQPTTFTLRSSTAPPSFSSASMVPSSSGPQLSATMPALAPMSMAAATPTLLPHSSAPQRPAFPTSSAPYMAQTSMLPTQSRAPLTATSPASLPLASPFSGAAVRPVQSPHPSTVPGSISGTMPSFTPVTSVATTPAAPMPPPTITAPKPVRPSSGDFTFQPLRSQVPASPTPPGANSPSVQNTSQVQLIAPQVPSFRPAGQNSSSAPQMGTQGWPMATNQTAPSHSPLRPPPSTSAPFSVNPTNIGPPPPFPNPRSGPMGPPSFSPAPQAPNSPATQMGRPVFSPVPPATQMGGQVYPPSPQPPNFSGSFAARPYNPLQPYQNHLPPASRPSSITPLNQQFHSNPFSPAAGRPAASPGANQIYDPFSPTSITPSPQQGGDPVKAARKPETDAEYEDLMASVGVK